MLNLKPDVVIALQAALPGGRVCYIDPEDMPEQPESEEGEEAQAEELPFITYSEVNNVPAEYVDDKEYTSFIEFALGIWGESSEQISPIAAAVDEQMTLIGFGRTYAADLPRDSEGTYQKAMRYAIVAACE